MSLFSMCSASCLTAQNEPEMPSSDCAKAQSELGLHCSYLPFSHIEYQWTNITIQMHINHENIEKIDNYWLNL